MKYVMTSPCDRCPFLNTPNMKRGFTLRRLREFASSEFPCHKTADNDDETGDYVANENSLHCAGALIFNEKRDTPNQMMRICERIGLYDRTKLDMKGKREMKRYSTLRRTSFKRKTFEEARDARQGPRRFGFKRTKGLKPGKALRARPDRKLAAWSRKVRERDDYTCQVTGIRDVKRNVAHHVAPRGRRPDLRLDLDNGITVTPEAHQWIHDHPIEATAAGWLSDETYEKARKAA